MRAPDHDDAELILKLYDLRREPVMRQARHFMMYEFFPKNYAELKPLLGSDHPKNAFFRQVTSYWEMAASFVNRHILHHDVFSDNCGEALFVYARLEPHLEALRSDYSPTFLVQIEKVVQNNVVIREKLGIIRERVKQLAR